MRWLLVVVLLVIGKVSAEKDVFVNARVKEVIEKYWERLRKEPRWTESTVVGSSVFDVGCDHDHFAQGRLKAIKRDSSYFQGTDPFPASEETYESIRIRVLDEYISDNDPHSCHYLNQQVGLEYGWTPSTSTSTSSTKSFDWTCGPNDLLDADKQTFFKDFLIPSVVDILQSTILVKRMKGNLVLSKQYHDTHLWCRNFSDPIPPYLLNQTAGEPNSDFIIFVSARPNGPTPSGFFQLASASACSHYTLQNGKYSRPLAGWINFNPAALSQLKSDSTNSEATFYLSDVQNQFIFSQYVRVGLHEFMHALGFSATLYSSYTNDAGLFYSDLPEYTQYGPIVEEHSYNNGHSGPIRYKMASPKVLALTQLYFDCPSMNGLELEEWDTLGSAPGSHWEKRLLGPELMTAVSSAVSIFSNFTLALLEDSGWYKVNYNLSETLRTGWNKGCSWVNYPCTPASWGSEFCSDKAIDRCDSQRVGRGSCSIGAVLYPAQFGNYYQHFSEPRLGGKPTPDYCPLYEPYNNYFCQDPNVLTSTLKGSNIYGETFGIDSWCFDYISNEGNSAGCYQIKCVINANTNQTQLALNLGGKWYGCPSEGGPLDVSTPNAGKIRIDCPMLNWYCQHNQFVYMVLSTGVINSFTSSWFFLLILVILS